VYNHPLPVTCIRCTKFVAGTRDKITEELGLVSTISLWEIVREYMVKRNFTKMLFYWSAITMNDISSYPCLTNSIFSGLFCSLLSPSPSYLIVACLNVYELSTVSTLLAAGMFPSSTAYRLHIITSAHSGQGQGRTAAVCFRRLTWFAGKWNMSTFGITIVNCIQKTVNWLIMITSHTAITQYRAYELFLWTTFWISDCMLSSLLLGL